MAPSVDDFVSIGNSRFRINNIESYSYIPRDDNSRPMLEITMQSGLTKRFQFEDSKIVRIIQQLDSKFSFLLEL